mgnify:CR=1 FL=1
MSLKTPQKVSPVAANVGGTVIGRPYAGGTFSVSDDGTLAYPQTRVLVSTLYNAPADSMWDAAFLKGARARAVKLVAAGAGS